LVVVDDQLKEIKKEKKKRNYNKYIETRITNMDLSKINEIDDEAVLQKLVIISYFFVMLTTN
jgi:hypothetical protein